MKRPPTELWGVSADIRPLLGGHRNVAFRTVGLKGELVFKSSRRSHDAISWLLPVHEYARRSGFIVPQLLCSHAGRYMDQGWTCETFVEGTRIQSGDGSSESLRSGGIADLRQKIMTFHRLTADVAQRPDFLSSKTLIGEGLVGGRLIGESLAGDVCLEAMPEELVRACRAAWRAVSDRPLAAIHGDLNADNLLRTPDGGLALLDWDESRRDHLLYDLGQLETEDENARRARLAFEVACSWQLEPEHARKVAKLL